LPLRGKDAVSMTPSKNLSGSIETASCPGVAHRAFALLTDVRLLILLASDVWFPVRHKVKGKTVGSAHTRPLFGKKRGKKTKPSVLSTEGRKDKSSPYDQTQGELIDYRLFN